jgi:hypothetical protein
LSSINVKSCLIDCMLERKKKERESEKTSFFLESRYDHR